MSKNCKYFEIFKLSFALIFIITALVSCKDDNPSKNEIIKPEENASGFCIITDSVPDAILEIRYYSTFNFIGHRINGYEQPTAIITKEAASALKKVSDEVMKDGYRLKIFDAYRPQCAVDMFVEWAKDTNDTIMKPYFYPMLTKERLIPEGYIAEKSGHTRGSTVDLTLFDMETEKDVDMGGPFDWFGELSHPENKDSVSEEQYQMRQYLKNVMLKNGFKGIDSEWWHFTLKDEPYPDTYFTFVLNENAVRK
ncbi:MAG: M15 family metallopeptidase [Bacilli bacterium]|nr:M15 family metallopeptidase [Bacilli bacterium]MCF0207531.1 M15 family metallopeptidase [Bacteroidales bacterium]